MRSKYRVFIGVVLLCSSGLVQGQQRKLNPIDDSAKDPTFFVFRARLFRAIQEKDAKFIYSILDEQIMNSFGGDGGIPEFKTTWRLERPNSLFWKELLTALSLGCTYDDDHHSFSAPYVYGAFPADLGEDYDVAAVIEDGVRVRKEPTTQSDVVKTLSFDIVVITDWQVKGIAKDKRDWVQVQLADGQKGFVAAEYVRSPTDYRAGFEKKNGKWLMTYFIGGD